MINLLRPKNYLFFIVCHLFLLVLVQQNLMAFEQQKVVLDWDRLKAAVMKFDSHPNEINAKKILNLIPEKIPAEEMGDSERALTYIIDESPKFLKGVKTGYDYLAEAAFRLYFIVLPGDALEELHISLSCMLVKKPRLYLQLLKNYAPQFPSYLEYPLDMTEILEIVPDIITEEDWKKRNIEELKLYEARLKALQSVTDKELLEIRDKCINRIKKNIEEIKERMKEKRKFIR